MQFDVDFAENGAIITADEVQSQYWKINTFTLFVQVVSFLVSDAWKSRTSVLSRGAAVTVELEGASTPGSLEPGKGSFWAEVVAVPPVGEVAAGTQLYSVRPYGAKEGEAPLTVARSLLRHRKVHTKAIFGITDDKKHDSFAAQWFMTATLKFLKTTYIDTGIWSK